MNGSTSPPDLSDLPSGIVAAQSALAEGALTAVDLTQGFLDRIAARDPDINSYLHVAAETALAEAAESDARRAAGAARGPLDGVPLAIKDNIDVAGLPTTAGVGALRGRIAARDATVVARLKAAGAVILGKLNMHEGAHGATTANEAYGYCHNPHRHGFTPGGSSGGSGAALAAGLCAGALGTDTLGSVRIPAAFCGVAGLKPTGGLVSTRGVVPLCWALDHVGPMAPRAQDLVPLLAAMAGFDADDPASRPAPSGMTIGGGRSLKGLKLGIFGDLDAVAGMPVDPAVAEAYRAARESLRAAGATLVEVSLEGYDHNRLRSKALLMIEADLAVIFSDDLARDPEGFTPVFRQGIAFGQAQASPRLAEARHLVAAVQPIARRLFAQVDALVTPTTPTPAFAFDQPMPKTLTAFTAFANYSGAPAVSVPMGTSADGLPLGLQVIAAPWEDARALRIAAAFEAASGRG